MDNDNFNEDDLEGNLTEVGALLGRVLVDRNKIEEADIENIVTHARERKLRFGEAAIELGLINHSDLEHAMAEQFDYPFLSEDNKDYPPELVAAFRPFSKKGQALRDLRARLLQFWDNDQNQSLAVVAPGINQGSSYIAANLSVVFSQLGQSTLLVDGDMLNARQHQIFNLQNNVGLSAALVSRTPVKLLIKRLADFRNLSVISAGAPPPNATELLSRRELAKTIADLQSSYGIVIVDTPPISANCGGEFIARACTNTVVVLRKHHTYLEDAEALMEKLESVGANVIGTVMTNF